MFPMSDTPYRKSTNECFSEVFPAYEDFDEFYTTCGIEPLISNTETANQTNTLKNLYYLLLARYANSPIASSDIYRFKLQVMAIIFQNGPTWEKRLAIQKKVRLLTEDQLVKSTTVYNQADHPEVSPDTGSTEPVGFVNHQNMVHNVSNLLTAYDRLNEVLKTDVTNEFLNRFAKLFAILPEACPIIYVTEGDEDDV